MSTKQRVTINHKTGSKDSFTVKRSEGTTHVHRSLKKSNGILGTRVLGSEKTLTNKTYYRG